MKEIKYYGKLCLWDNGPGTGSGFRIRNIVGNISKSKDVTNEKKFLMKECKYVYCVCEITGSGRIMISVVDPEWFISDPIPDPDPDPTPDPDPYEFVV